MPTYEYACRACGHEFEEFQSMSAKPLRKCPECAKSALERLIGTGAAIIFKGGGFYETDYRSESYKKGAEAEKKSSEPASSDTTPCACGSKTASECASGKSESAKTESKPVTPEVSAKPAKAKPSSAKQVRKRAGA